MLYSFFAMIVSSGFAWWLVKSQTMDKSKFGDKRVSGLSRKFEVWTAFSQLGRQLWKRRD
jgi:hypothetical protein